MHCNDLSTNNTVYPWLLVQYSTLVEHSEVHLYVAVLRLGNLNKVHACKDSQFRVHTVTIGISGKIRKGTTRNWCVVGNVSVICTRALTQLMTGKGSPETVINSMEGFFCET